MSLYVNGADKGQITCNGTANWDTWSNKVAGLIALNKGTNYLLYRYDSDDSANINLDYLDVILGVKYEAENASLSGGAIVASDHPGFTGSGFVAGYWNSGAATQFTVSTPAAGNYCVSLNYANATGSAKTLSIYVNGTRIRQTGLPSLASWDTWGTQMDTLSLNAGSNMIVYKYDSGDSGNVNFDYLAITGTKISRIRKPDGLVAMQ